MGATPTPLLPVKECGTPDTVWGARVDADWIKFTARFPVPLIKDSERNSFIAEMHAAMLPVVERLFERRWAQMFAGKFDAEGRIYPQHYGDLWPEAALSSDPQPLGSAREATEDGQHKTNPEPGEPS